MRRKVIDPTLLNLVAGQHIDAGRFITRHFGPGQIERGTAGYVEGLATTSIGPQ